jgi:hypothetical protein
MDMMLSKQSKSEQALARIPTRPVAAGKDADFDVQHLTANDIAKLEDALNTMDLEEMVTTVDAIVGRHHASRRSRGRLG